ncbi:hypothetical protein HK101_009314 [Irineochytrium annulatum]|nr:hypothetical protein HK101_009314 [Irineochytrium annulatum]
MQSISAQNTGSSLGAGSQLTQAEIDRYSAAFESCKPLGGFVTGEAARDLFLRSGLTLEVLSSIWALVDPSGTMRLNLNQFFAAMFIIMRLKAGRFQSVPTSIPADLWNSISSATSSIGASPSSSIASPATPMPSGFGTSPKPDLAKKGVLTGEECYSFFLKSKLDPSALAQIWDLSNVMKNGKLTREEFAVSMHLIKVAMSGEALPKTLPPNLIPPRFRPAERPPVPLPPGAPKSRTPSADLLSNDAFGGTTQHQDDDPFGLGSAFGEPEPSAASVEKRTPPPLPEPRADSSADLTRRMTTLGSAAAVTTGSWSVLTDDRSADLARSKNQVADLQSQIDGIPGQQEALRRKRLANEAELKQVQAVKEDLMLKLSQTSAALDHESRLAAENQSILDQERRVVEFARQELSQAEAILDARRKEREQVENAIRAGKEELGNVKREAAEVTSLCKRYQEEVGRMKVEFESVHAELNRQTNLLVVNRQALVDAQNDYQKMKMELKREEDLIEYEKRRNFETSQKAAVQQTVLEKERERHRQRSAASLLHDRVMDPVSIPGGSMSAGNLFATQTPSRQRPPAPPPPTSKSNLQITTGPVSPFDAVFAMTGTHDRSPVRSAYPEPATVASPGGPPPPMPPLSTKPSRNSLLLQDTIMEPHSAPAVATSPFEPPEMPPLSTKPRKALSTKSLSEAFKIAGIETAADGGMPSSPVKAMSPFDTAMRSPTKPLSPLSPFHEAGPFDTPPATTTNTTSPSVASPNDGFEAPTRQNDHFRERSSSPEGKGLPNGVSKLKFQHAPYTRLDSVATSVGSFNNFEEADELSLATRSTTLNRRTTLMVSIPDLDAELKDGFTGDDGVEVAKDQAAGFEDAGVVRGGADTDFDFDTSFDNLNDEKKQPVGGSAFFTDFDSAFDDGAAGVKTKGLKDFDDAFGGREPKPVAKVQRSFSFDEDDLGAFGIPAVATSQPAISPPLLKTAATSATSSSMAKISSPREGVKLSKEELDALFSGSPATTTTTAPVAMPVKKGSTDSKAGFAFDDADFAAAFTSPSAGSPAQKTTSPTQGAQASGAKPEMAGGEVMNEVKELMELGFSKAAAVDALERHGYNVAEASNFLIDKSVK